MSQSVAHTFLTRRRRAFALAGALVLAAGTAGGQASEPGPAPGPLAAAALSDSSRPAPFAAFSASAEALRDSIVARARAQIGRRYRIGGTSPDKGFDCSGLVKYVVAALGMNVPRTAATQARAGAPVPTDTSRLRPGDLLTFGYGRSISHVGIYVGNGRFIHASSKAGRVIESPLIRPPARRIKPWQGARRLVASADSIAPAAAR